MFVIKLKWGRIVKSFSKLLLFCGLAFCLLPIDSNALKIEDTNFGQILAPGANILHPIFGLALYLRGQKILINLYQHGNPEHPLIKVIHTLFHHDMPNELLRPSASDANVTYGFGPYEVGWLLALLIFKPELFSTPGLYANKSMKRNVDISLEKVKLDVKLATFMKHLNIAHKNRVALENPSRKKNAIRGTKIAKLLDFSQNAIKALKLGTGDAYSADFVPLLFNAFACAKSKNKRDLFNFVINGFIKHALQATNLKLLDAYLTPYGKEVVINKKTQESFLKEKSSLANIKKAITPYYTTLIPNEKLPHSLIFPGTAYLTNLIPMPEKIVQLYITKYDKAPDCTEAAILHLVSSILFDNRKGIFSLEMLSPNLRNRGQVKTVFEYLTRKQPNDQDFRTTWFEFVSQRDNIDYKKDGYSIAARTKNIFNLLTQIFEIEATSWEELGTELSSEKATISFSGPSLGSNYTSGLILFKKIYPGGSVFSSTVSVNHDNHAGILDSKFEQANDNDQSMAIAFTNSLALIGLPQEISAALAPLSAEEFSIKTLPKKIKNAKQLFFVLSRDLRQESFFELMRLIDKNKEIKDLIDTQYLEPDDHIHISLQTTDWLLKSGQYKNSKYWVAITHKPRTFISQALFQNNYAAINFMLNKILTTIEITSPIKRNDILKEVWTAIVDLHKDIYEIFPLCKPKGEKNKIAPIGYRYNGKEVNAIIQKLFKLDPIFTPCSIKHIIAKDISANTSLTRKFIHYDNSMIEKNGNFTFLNPHMLYLLIRNAITDPDRENREASLSLLMEDPAYLTKKIYRTYDLVTLTKQKGNILCLWKSSKEHARTKDIRKKLIKNADYEEKKKKWAVVPYTQNILK